MAEIVTRADTEARIISSKNRFSSKTLEGIESIAETDLENERKELGSQYLGI